MPSGYSRSAAALRRMPKGDQDNTCCVRGRWRAEPPAPGPSRPQSAETEATAVPRHDPASRTSCPRLHSQCHRRCSNSVGAGHRSGTGPGYLPLLAFSDATRPHDRAGRSYGCPW